MKRGSVFTDKTKGFTLLEVLVVLGIIVVLGAFTAPAFQSFQLRNEVDLAANTVVQSLYRAQALAQANDGDSMWGVAITTIGVTLFKGINYGARDPLFDEIILVNQNVSRTGLTEVVYSKVYGLPNTTGSIGFSANDHSVSITLNAKGVIDY